MTARALVWAWAAGAELDCRWWALCENEATQTRAHPVLGNVPICDRCQAKCEEIAPSPNHHMQTTRKVHIDGDN